MAIDVDEVISDACASGISCLEHRRLLVVIAQALAGTMTADELIEAACVSGIDCIESELTLLQIIAQGIASGGGGGGGGGSGVVSDGAIDPVAAPANPAVANWYVNTVTQTAWLWPAGGAAWQQIV